MSNMIEEIKKQARLELARRDFFEYCKLTAPDFYKEDRKRIGKVLWGRKKYSDYS